MDEASVPEQRAAVDTETRIDTIGYLVRHIQQE